jgi:hypothetical protein
VSALVAVLADVHTMDMLHAQTLHVTSDLKGGLGMPVGLLVHS